jgi:hypothetical protein
MKKLIILIVFIFISCSTYIVFSPTFNHKRTINFNKDKDKDSIITKKLIKNK